MACGPAPGWLRITPDVVVGPPGSWNAQVPWGLSSRMEGTCAYASIAAALEAGDKAPDFTLPSTSGEKISLT